MLGQISNHMTAESIELTAIDDEVEGHGIEDHDEAAEALSISLCSFEHWVF